MIMTNKELLRKIYKENRKMNRNLLRLANIGMIGLLGKSALEAKKKDDDSKKNLAKTGLLLVAVSEVILLVSDFIDYRKTETEEELEEYL
mgnify:CR=1 FL=1